MSEGVEKEWTNHLSVRSGVGTRLPAAVPPVQRRLDLPVFIQSAPMAFEKVSDRPR